MTSTATETKLRAAMASPSIFTEAVGELVAIGAAIASNCQPCFKFHYDKAKKLGVSDHDMSKAVAVAQRVKEAPAQAVFDLAARYLFPDANDVEPSTGLPESTSASGTACCTPQPDAGEAKASRCC